jgi:hypothetical protein
VSSPHKYRDFISGVVDLYLPPLFFSLKKIQEILEESKERQRSSRSTTEEREWGGLCENEEEERYK